MRANKQTWILIIAAAAASVLASVWGLGLSYNSRITPRSSLGEFQGIHGDGWVEEEATITFRNLETRGNRLLMSFDSWRPEGLAPGALKIHVCDTEVAHFAVNTPGQTELIPLKGSCDPRVLRFEMLNAFPAPDSPRRLGVKLNFVEVTSRLGFPILSFELSGQVALCLFLLTVLFMRALRSTGFAAAGLFVPLSGFLLLQNSFNVNLGKPYPVWFLFMCFAVGLWLASQLKLEADTEAAPARWLSLTRKGSGLTWTIVALVVTTLAGILRFHSLSFGLPSNYHPDEVPKINAIMRMVESGNLNPKYFLHPSLLLYLTYGANIILRWFDVWDAGFRDTAYLAGRTVSATAGTLSVFFVYLIGSRLYTRPVGVMAAALLAVFPLHVTCSRYMKEDALLLFMILACVHAMIVAVQERKLGYLLLAGFLAGVSASSKYSGLLMGGVVCMAPWLRSRSFKPDREMLVWLVPALALMPIGFIVCTPYSVLDFPKFSNDFGSEKHHMLRGHTNTVDAWSQYWMYHFSRSVVPGVTTICAAAGVIAIGLFAWRRRVEDLFVVAMILFFYLPAEWVKAKPAPQPERYILPCLPFLALAAAEAIRIVSQSRAKVLAFAAIPLLLFFPTQRSVNLARELEPDTRGQMAAWMNENLPHGSKVYLDWKPYSPRFFNNEFDVTYIPRAQIIGELEINKLKRSGYDYLVLSSLFYARYFTEPNSDAAIRQRFRELFDRVAIVKEFSASEGTYGFNNPTVTLFSLKPHDFQKIEQEIALRNSGKLDKTSNEAMASFRWRTQSGLVMKGR